MCTKPTKSRYQFFKEVDKIYFDAIREDIQTMSTPCSEIFELTTEEYSLLRKAMHTSFKYESMQLRCLDRWVETSDIMKDINAAAALEEKQKEKALELARKAEAKKQKLAEQSSGKNGKVKSAAKAERLAAIFPGAGFRGGR